MSYHPIVLASNNPGKLHEIQNILAGLSYDIVPQSEFGVAEMAETGLSFVENAILKARNASQVTNLPALADDSGLEIDALHGEPGIYSARYAGTQATDQANIIKVLDNLKDLAKQNRKARFQCIMVLLRHAKDPAPIIAQGTWEGNILYQPQGRNGFGYDPIFYVPTHHCSAAELPLNIKNQLSHRGQALRELVKKMDFYL